MIQENPKIIVTRHASMRMKQRLGLNKKASERIAYRAFERGFDGSNITGMMPVFLMETLNYEQESKKILYGENIYIFGREEDNFALITVYRMDMHYRELVEQMKKKLKKKEGDKRYERLLEA